MHLIRSFAKIAEKYPNWKLEIFGEGEERNMLTNLILSLNLQNQIFIKGHTNDVGLELESAAFFVLSSRMEGFALVLIEAMSYNLPVISYDCPFGPSYIIKDGENGLLVPLINEDKLADSMEALIQNEETRKKMGEKARMRAEEFLPEKIAKQWMDLFEVLNTKKHG